jgi:hypothetical protein
MSALTHRSILLAHMTTSLTANRGKKLMFIIGQVGVVRIKKLPQTCISDDGGKWLMMNEIGTKSSGKRKSISFSIAPGIIAG